MAREKSKSTQMQRMQAIRKSLLRGVEVVIDILARQLKVSCMTIRRDLEQLENQGDIIRTYGGAALTQHLTFEFSFRNREHKNNAQKQAIAQQAAALVQNGQVVMLDTGTTTLQIAQALVGKQDVTLITTSLAIVSKVQFASGIKVVLLGGFLRRGSLDMHGPLTEQNIEQFKTDIVFIGADAIDNQSTTYTNDLRVLNLDRKMAANAARVMVVADSSKFGKSEMCKVLGSEEYDLILTEAQINKSLLEQLQQKEIKIKLA